jgi:hypothetical protein
LVCLLACMCTIHLMCTILVAVGAKPKAAWGCGQ